MMNHTDDFERSNDSGLGADWAHIYEGAGWGRMKIDGEGVRYVNPPAGEYSTAGIICKTCGHTVTVTTGDVIRQGDPRLCVHLGGPTVESGH